VRRSPPGSLVPVQTRGQSLLPSRFGLGELETALRGYAQKVYWPATGDGRELASAGLQDGQRDAHPAGVELGPE